MDDIYPATLSDLPLLVQVEKNNELISVAVSDSVPT